MNYWAERHRRERAEAENARLRETVEAMNRDTHQHSLGWWVREFYAALATPPPEGEHIGPYPDRNAEKMARMKREGELDEIGHGESAPHTPQGRQYGAVDEALRAYQAMIDEAPNVEGGASLDEWCWQEDRIVRRHIERGVPDAVRQLPEKWRNEPSEWTDEGATAVCACADELERALASAPASVDESCEECGGSGVIGDCDGDPSADGKAIIENCPRCVPARESVPDAVRQLPEKMRRQASQLQSREALPCRRKVQEFVNLIYGFSGELGREIANAPASGAVPEGYKPVPVEPTIEMIVAGGQEAGVADVYRAMIEAAPSSQHEQGE